MAAEKPRRGLSRLLQEARRVSRETVVVRHADCDRFGEDGSRAARKNPIM
jgi:hypothetical protein